MSDKYTGYVDEMLVKGTWWAFNGGPKPRNFTGNIDNDPESIRNLSLIITGASQSNGHFPNDSYGKKYAVLTIRYGESDNRLYIQKVIDIDSKIEYERYYQETTWGTYARVTSYSDSNQTAQKAYDQSLTNAGAIGRINQAIGRNDNQAPGTPIYTRLNNVETNITGPNGINSKITSLQNGASNDNYARTLAQDLKTKAGKLLNQSDTSKLINVHMGCSVIDVPSGDSSLFPYWNNEASCRNWASDRGCTSENSVLFASTGYVMPGEKQGSGHGVHIEGMQFSNSTGCWYITFDSSTIPPERIYGLYVNWILFVNNGTWN